MAAVVGLPFHKVMLRRYSEIALSQTGCVGLHRAFRDSGKNFARMLGIADYPFITVEHPIGIRSQPEIKKMAEAAYEQALPILTA